MSREVIRIMIREGLLPDPQRPARNVAEYDEAHVRGIRAVRELQQSSRMTFKQIKAALDNGGLDSGRPAATDAHLDALLAGLFGVDEAPPVELSALEDRLPHARNDAAVFERLGMLKIIETSSGGALSFADARLVEIWGTIRETGFVEETGFPPDNIAFYLDAAKTIARREAEIFFGNSRVPISEAQAARMLHIALPLMLDFLGLLRLKSFMQTLNERRSREDLNTEREMQ